MLTTTPHTTSPTSSIQNTTTMGLFSKKEKPAEEGEASARARLFQSRSKAKVPTQAAASSNPYAIQSQSSDPYAAGPSGSAINRSQPPQIQQYAAPPSNGQPPAYNGNNAGFPAEKTPVPPGGYGSSKFGSSDAYGQQRGYGSNDAYGTGSSAAPQRPGGYGGLGRSNSQDTMATDAGREALFGGARERLAAKAPAQNDLPPEDNPAFGGGGGGGNAYGSSSTGAYGGYDPDRQLTAEEEEEEQVSGLKDQIRDLKRRKFIATIISECLPTNKPLRGRCIHPQRPPHRRPSRRNRPCHPRTPRHPRRNDTLRREEPRPSFLPKPARPGKSRRTQSPQPLHLRPQRRQPFHQKPQITRARCRDHGDPPQGTSRTRRYEKRSVFVNGATAGAWQRATEG